MRLLAVRSKQCASPKNRYHCPEVFLDVVADKLTSTAVLFLNVELLSEFYYNFPRELDLRLGRHLSDAEVERFAREDARVRKHLDVIRRKELLEMVLGKIESLQQFEGRTKAATAVTTAMVGAERTKAAAKQRSKGWSIF
jgi:dynamin-like GTPase MGM1, mitochondrial